VRKATKEIREIKAILVRRGLKVQRGQQVYPLGL